MVANNSAKGSVDVVHLVWLPYGTQLFERFLASYTTHDSGYPHRLVLLFNGVNKEEELAPYLSVIANYKVDYTSLIHFGACQDIDAYFWAASQLKSQYILFVNSYSEFVVSGWLGFFMAHMHSTNVGLVGATGSWQSYYSDVFTQNTWRWEHKQKLNVQWRKYKLFLKALFVWSRLFRRFPNPHIRTNAFMLERQLFLSLWHVPLRNKLMAYVMESGYKGITNQVLLKGLQVLVVDKFGNSYSKAEWKNARVFWSGEQENLMITDNQTSQFENANTETKQRLTYLAWGKQ